MKIPAGFKEVLEDKCLCKSIFVLFKKGQKKDSTFSQTSKWDKSEESFGFYYCKHYNHAWLLMNAICAKYRNA